MSATLAPLRHHPFRHLIIGTTANLPGNGVAPIALAFAVLDATGSVSSLGLVVGAHSVAGILFLLYGGVLADRLPRGRCCSRSPRIPGCWTESEVFAAPGAIPYARTPRILFLS
ncbi:MFS transporter [Streptomyces sp. NBC_00847]|uniref:MFS transporter n=1 Tax=unclassified Streptomyces TaxID=2593676 RepID=UPI0022573F84|nr:MFS transporter [Streptomyces sp. NBC_00847]MCX4878259.1 MFS transporter [Streptomyces sp. NBC_00847]